MDITENIFIRKDFSLLSFIGDIEMPKTPVVNYAVDTNLEDAAVTQPGNTACLGGGCSMAGC
jgi:hypothetical protein